MKSKKADFEFSTVSNSLRPLTARLGPKNQKTCNQATGQEESFEQISQAGLIRFLRQNSAAENSINKESYTDKILDRPNDVAGKKNSQLFWSRNSSIVVHDWRWVDNNAAVTNARIVTNGKLGKAFDCSRILEAFDSKHCQYKSSRGRVIRSRKPGAT